ncbi:hypothetical protein PT155_08645 [Erysipelothrix rhusiopathiae]|nr:hypothetical protein [Erysipelothrix rhusiopathiae]MDE8252281.1 hypothetical protein [Erysipelothrix rhusiopathiae]MDE8260745.1 hypothetical protein [Erysipelothrix rhusiopathiae]MDE8265815.1 hypothetical protein [Erysipelothrix rhusiopathiae]MDE8267534.1 hypothetical protein [Erysipelothrix rhusiopathiae]
MADLDKLKTAIENAEKKRKIENNSFNPPTPPKDKKRPKIKK